MDPKAPRTATATLVLGMVTWILSVVSVVFKLGLTPGFNIEEIVLLVIGAFFFLISFFASREREQMEMIQSLSVEEQFAAIESQPTKYKSSNTTTDHYGFETQNNSDSQTIIASILGQPVETNREEMNTAKAALTSEKGGELGAEAVRHKTAPHAQTEQFREVFKSSNTTQEGFERIKVQNIPLPGEKTARPTPDLPWLDSKHEFQSSGIAHIPLPETAQTQPASKSLEKVDVPQMPNLDDLFTETTPKKDTSLPTLPNLDDLF
jgi:hypothetical protein